MGLNARDKEMEVNGGSTEGEGRADGQDEDLPVRPSALHPQGGYLGDWSDFCVAGARGRRRRPARPVA